MLLVGGANGRVWYLHRFARKDVRWVSSATDPPSFILSKVDGQAAWTVCWAMWRRANLLHGRLIWCDRVAAPEANPVGLPLLRSLVEIWCPVHVSGGEFAPPGPPGPLVLWCSGPPHCPGPWSWFSRSSAPPVLQVFLAPCCGAPGALGPPGPPVLLVL